LKEYALSWITENQSRIIDMSDSIWEFAEVGLKEVKSSALLSEELRKAGFSVDTGVAGMPTAFVASYGRGKPVIGIMGEYDALPGLSQKPVPKREPLKEGAPGHGCGHNIHGVSGVAGALASKEAIEKEGVEATVKFFGCPAEETLVGKVFMIREGLFHGVDAVLSHHPSALNVAKLSSYTAMNSAKFHFYGAAAHAGSSPELGRGASDAVELMNVGVNYMREHIPRDASIHYVIEKAGDEPNVIPAYARVWYYVRAAEREQVDSIYNWVLKIADGADLMAGTTHRAEFLTGCSNTLPNSILAELVVRNMRLVGAPTYDEDELRFAREIGRTVTPEQKMIELKKSRRPGWEKVLDVDLDNEVLDPFGEGEVLGGSTDVGDVSWNAPTMEFSTTAFVLGAPGHSWQHTATSKSSIGHKSLIFAAKVLAFSVCDLISDPKLIEKARAEFLTATRNRAYESPLPPELNPPLHQL